jgi:hypothetical protein
VKESTVFWLKCQRTSLFNLFPAKYRRNIKDIFHRGNYNY